MKFAIGDRVITADALEHRDFTDETIQTRRVNAAGEIVEEHRGHGLCFSVRHDDGVVSCYDPDELTPLLKPFRLPASVSRIPGARCPR